MLDLQVVMDVNSQCVVNSGRQNLEFITTPLVVRSDRQMRKCTKCNQKRRIYIIMQLHGFTSHEMVHFWYNWYDFGTTGTILVHYGTILVHYGTILVHYGT
jgi:hypothetical protein